MATSAQEVQKLREMTGAGMMAAKKALEESKGDIDAAVEILRKKGEAKAGERSGRGTSEGAVASYIHANKKLGAIVELRCETDFVARTPEFQALAYDLAMHVAASNPLYLEPTAVPEAVIEKEREIISEQMGNEGIPEKVREKALTGKLEKFYSEVCLLRQSYVKDPDTTIADLVTGIASKTGENIRIERFARFSI